MNWAWTMSLDQIWRSPTFPMWLTLGAAAFFGIIVLVTLLRAEKSVANGALTVITLLAISVAAAATIRGFGPDGQSGPTVTAVSPPVVASLPALSCIDDLAGDIVLAACEKALFGSPEAAAAAGSYAAADIARLVSHGDVAAANKTMTPDLMALRRAVERDRYGLVAHVLQTRDRCQPGDCAAYAAMTDHNQIANNMAEGTYDGLIARHAPNWNAPPVVPGVAALPGNLPASAPTGKPTNAEFPTSASIPPINIMTPEPPLTPQRPSSPAAGANAQAPAPRTAAAPAPAPVQATAAKKPAAPKNRPQAQAPVQLAPAPADADN
jgi:hypothetical protein